MNRIWRRASAAVSRVSAVVTRWRRHVVLPRMPTGHEPESGERRMSEQMEARARAIDELLNSGALERHESLDDPGSDEPFR